MPMFDLSQSMNVNTVRDTHKAQLDKKQADAQKVQQEVFDLSVNNAVQKDVAKFMTSPEYTGARSAATQAATTKSIQVMQDKQLEDLEVVFETAGDSMTQEQYSYIRGQVSDLIPAMAASLPEKYSPAAQKALMRARGGFIRNKKQRRELQRMGINNDWQVKAAREKYKDDLSMLEITGRQQMDQLTSRIESGELTALMQDEGAYKRALLGVSNPFLRMANEYFRNNDPARGMLEVKKAQDAVMADIAAKRAASAGSQSVDDDRLAKARRADDKQLKENLTTQYAAKTQVSMDKDSGTFDAIGLTGVSSRLFDLADKNNVPAHKKTSYVQERMILDPANDRWIQLSLDPNGDPVDLGNGPITSQMIVDSIGTTVDIKYLGKGTSGDWWGDNFQITNLREALEIYDAKLKMNGKEGIYPSDTPQSRSQAVGNPTA